MSEKSLIDVTVGCCIGLSISFLNNENLKFGIHSKQLSIALLIFSVVVLVLNNLKTNNKKKVV